MHKSCGVQIVSLQKQNVLCHIPLPPLLLHTEDKVTVIEVCAFLKCNSSLHVASASLELFFQKTTFTHWDPSNVLLPKLR